MITFKTYYSVVEEKGLKRSDLPKPLQAGWDYINRITKEGSTSGTYYANKKVKEIIDTYLEKLNGLLNKSETKASKARSEDTPSSSKTKAVESYSLEHKFIKRFLNLDGKAKTQNQIRLFINALQRAIRERRIRKTSTYAQEIVSIQEALIKLHGKFKNQGQVLVVSISQKKKARYLKILGRQVEMLSVRLIKSYINLQGKVVASKKATTLYNRIANAINSKKLTKGDRYWKEINGILNHLKSFLKKNPSSGMLIIEPRTLSGLSGIVGIPVGSLNGVTQAVPSSAILTGKEIAELKFDTLTFQGKWKEFMGNPNRGFSFMLYGKPKFGKTILALQFADYLARNFGTVLYIASEEQIGATLQSKIKAGKYFHPDLLFTGEMPEDFRKFDFVFIDSVNNYGLTAEDLQRLKKENPSTSFGYIFQVTKNGVFRGSNEFQHDVDSVWEVPEKGKAIQYGRYNQGGELEIFEKD